MIAPPIRQGDFVWCCFPEREAPTRPGPLHVGYVLAVAAQTGGDVAMAAYTTSQPWVGPMPMGVLAFGRAAAAGLGQARAFVIDLRRLAYVPCTPRWFPRMPDADAGVIGRAPKALRDRLNAIATDLVRRRPETLSRSGPPLGS